MAGIIIYIPQAPLINPTTEIVPVKSATTFVDSNIKNIVDDIVITQNTITQDPAGIKLDFINESYELGDPFGININIDNYNGILNINGIPLITPIITPDKTLPVTIDGLQYYIQLYLPTP